MKKLTLAFTGFFFVLYSSFGQKNIYELGKIGIADLNLKSCSFEPDAVAMKLLDIQETRFEYGSYGSRLKTERRIRIKIFSERGYDHASIKLPYFSKKGESKIKAIKAVIYNIDKEGKVIKKDLSNKDFFKTTAIDNLKTLTFTFPELRAGSVIEYAYTIIEKNVAKIDPWFVQDNIPVAYAYHSVHLPTEAIFKEKTFGYDTIPYDLELKGMSGNTKIYAYHKENIKSFKNEPFMSSKKDNTLRMIYRVFPKMGMISEIMSNPKVLWNLLGIEFIRSDYYKSQVLGKIKGTEKIIDSADHLKIFTEKISYLHSVVRDRMSSETEQSAGLGVSLQEVWDNKDGTSSDINMIFLNLLNQSKINCHPLLISTRDNGYIDMDFPSLGQLNGFAVLAFDSSKVYVIDASEKWQTIDIPPLNLLNRNVLLLAKDSTQWLNVSDERILLKKHMNIFASFDSTGKLSGSSTIQHFDYAKSLEMDTTESKKENFYSNEKAGVIIKEITRENYDNSGEPLTEHYNFEYELPATDQFYFINPQFLAKEDKNPFTYNYRETDMDFISKQEHILNLQFSIPINYTVEHLPKNILIIAPDSSLTYQRKSYVRNNEVNMSQVFLIKRSRFSKDEYEGIFDFYKKMYALKSEEIVIKKSE